MCPFPFSLSSPLSGPSIVICRLMSAITLLDYPSLSSLVFDSLPLSKVKVLYGGTELFDDEVRKTFHSDMLLALFSGGCITVLVYVLTSFSGKTPTKHSIKQIHSASDFSTVKAVSIQSTQDRDASVQ